MSSQLRCWCLQSMLLVALTTARAQIAVPGASYPGPSRVASGTEPTDAGIVAKSRAGSPGTYELEPGEDPQNRLLTPFLKHLATDQENFWTKPAHLRIKDLRWALPFTGLTAGLIASDSWLSKQVPDKPDQLKRSQNISNYAVFSLVGAAGASYVFGHMTHNDHLREAGFLSGEAAVNSTGVAYAFKPLTQRPRPFVGDGNGTFFQGGSSFPSEHTAVARLIALGYMPSATLGIRPWTRMECARLLQEAGERLADHDAAGQEANIYRALSQEFVQESSRLDGARNVGATVDSVYTRVMNISGPPLRDGYHFGQTIINDYGRPFGEGLNLVTGTTARAVAGPFGFYVRGE